MKNRRGDVALDVVDLSPRRQLFREGLMSSKNTTDKKRKSLTKREATKEAAEGRGCDN